MSSETRRKLNVVFDTPQGPSHESRPLPSYESQTQAYSTWGGKLLQHTDVLYKIQHEKRFQPITVQLAPTEACFVGGTKVSLLNGTERTLKDLAENETAPFWVYSYDLTNNRIVPGKAIRSRLTRKDSSLVKITLDSGAEIICTPDHEFLLRAGEYLQAKDLRVNTSLMPLYRRESIKEDDNQSIGYEMFLEPSLNEWLFTHRVVSDNIQLRSVSVDNSNELIEVPHNKKMKTRHHLDFNKKNNAPENLVWMQFSTHRKFHQNKSKALIEKGIHPFQLWAQTDQHKNASSDRMKILNEKMKRGEIQSNYRSKEELDLYREASIASQKALAQEGKHNAQIRARIGTHHFQSAEFKEKNRRRNYELLERQEHPLQQANNRKKNSDTQLRLLQEGRHYFNSERHKLASSERLKLVRKYHSFLAANGITKEELSFKQWKEQISNPSNHKVVKVEHLSYTEDVYCLEVEQFHNFALSAGVFVSNCDSNCDFCSVSWRDVTKKLSWPVIEKGLREFKELGAKALELSVRGDEIIPLQTEEGFISLRTIEQVVNEKKVSQNSFTLTEDNKLALGAITQWIKHPQKEPLYTLVLQEGRRVTVTKSHSVFFYEDGKVVYKPVSLAKPGDAVVLTRPPRPTKYQTIVETTYMSRNKPVTAKFDVTEDFCRLLGYFVAEGSFTFQREKILHGVTFSFGSYELEREQKYIEDVKNTLFKLGYTCSVDKFHNKTTVRCSSKELASLFIELGVGIGAKNKKVPDLIFNVSTEYQIEFLKGLYGGTRCYRHTFTGKKFLRNTLQIGTASKSLQSTLLFLLDQMGVSPTAETYVNKQRKIEGRELGESQVWKVSISNKPSIQKLIEVVKWLDKAPTYSESKYSTGGPRSKKKFISDDAYTLNIVKIIEEHDVEEFVYDISVDETHRFITAQGILCHNTGGGNPLLYKDGDKNINHVIELAHSLGYEIGVITNTEKLSRHLKPENANKLSWIRVSLIKLDEGKKPEDYDFSGFPLSKLGFSYIIYDGTTVESIEKIAKLVELNPEIKFVRIASDCLTEQSISIKKEWGDIVKTLDAHSKFFIKEINEDFHAFEEGCWVGMIRPYWVWNGVYMCTSHVLKHRNYHPTWKLSEIDKIKETWDKINERFKSGKNPYDIDIQSQCFHCYYSKSNQVLNYVVKDLPDKNFA